eukprot:2738461-Amphidinium_carterae.1
MGVWGRSCLLRAGFVHPQQRRHRKRLSGGGESYAWTCREQSHVNKREFLIGPSHIADGASRNLVLGHQGPRVRSEA